MISYINKVKEKSNPIPVHDTTAYLLTQGAKVITSLKLWGKYPHTHFYIMNFLCKSLIKIARRVSVELQSHGTFLQNLEELQRQWVRSQFYQW
jgi:hypothetical protein